jgi:hypothetical protein
MAKRMVLITVLSCLTLFGLRGVLPAIFENSSSLSIYADTLFVIAALVLVGVAVYEAFITATRAPKL